MVYRYKTNIVFAWVVYRYKTNIVFAWVVYRYKTNIVFAWVVNYGGEQNLAKTGLQSLGGGQETICEHSY